jgi:hypothetical protein
MNLYYSIIGLSILIGLFGDETAWAASKSATYQVTCSVPSVVNFHITEDSQAESGGSQLSEENKISMAWEDSGIRIKTNLGEDAAPQEETRQSGSIKKRVVSVTLP